MNVSQLLEVMLNVDMFQLRDRNYPDEILYEDTTVARKVRNNWVLSLPVDYFGIADADTIIFYVDGTFFEEDIF